MSTGEWDDLDDDGTYGPPEPDPDFERKYRLENPDPWADAIVPPTKPLPFSTTPPF